MRNSKVQYQMPSLDMYIKTELSLQEVARAAMRSGEDSVVASMMIGYFRNKFAYFEAVKKSYYVMLRNKGYSGITINGTGGLFIVEAKSPKFRKLVAISARASEPFDQEMAMREDEYNIVSTRVI